MLMLTGKLDDKELSMTVFPFLFPCAQIYQLPIQFIEHEMLIKMSYDVVERALKTLH